MRQGIGCPDGFSVTVNSTWAVSRAAPRPTASGSVNQAAIRQGVRLMVSASVAKRELLRFYAFRRAGHVLGRFLLDRPEHRSEHEGHDAGGEARQAKTPAR